MWMVDPRLMCREHLLGEHVEIHMFVGSINRGLSMAGFLTGNLLEPASLHRRHNELVEEMTRRGYKHKSNLPEVSGKIDMKVKIDRVAAQEELFRRCPFCGVEHA